MLDRYFDLAPAPHDPVHVWQWVGNLIFHENKSAKESTAVSVLQNEDYLRQGIIRYVFGNLTNRDQIFDIKVQKFGGRTHTGLVFKAKDYKFTVDVAFENDNPALWASFMARHQFYLSANQRGENDLRRHMREQAAQKPLFMREWVRTNRENKSQFVRDDKGLHRRHNRRMKRREKEKEETRVASKQFLIDNRELIESGRHWRALHHFAGYMLHRPDKIDQDVGDASLVRIALLNCFDYIKADIPSLKRLAELQCASQYLHVEEVLYAACLEVFRSKGTLASVDLSLLKALRTNIHSGGYKVDQSEISDMRAEVDRLIFPDIVCAETFLREYLEPQLAVTGCERPEVWLLREDSFTSLCGKLSVEWLVRFPRQALSALDTLFEVAAEFGSREVLNNLILRRCAEFISGCPSYTGSDYYEQRRIFWFTRAWYFLTNPPSQCWNWLAADKDNLLILEARSGRWAKKDNPLWPELTPEKIGKILDAFVDQWPVVHLPSHYGSDSPNKQKAFRYLSELVWDLDSGEPCEALPIICKLIEDPRCAHLHGDLKSIRSVQEKRLALRDFVPPLPREIVELLDQDAVVTVEGLRQLVLQELEDFQKSIIGGEFNSGDIFYECGVRLGEVKSTERIAERLNLKLESKGISVVKEHEVKNANRVDFSATKMISGKRRVLFTEVKGQWHEDLYTAASAQLYDRYSIHPDAEKQGIYLVLWFGKDEKVADRKNRDISTAEELKVSIEAKMPAELTGRIDVFVLDVSKPS
ncbi:MAG: hypothetical protein KKF24_03080 [Gammaproteobacteria bacterium]|nr:hypothetical protein [Gammaproteobacteria bacterium]MBU1831658.1 hypothetical protein [Gammaproteobacteria bacterium]